eukprot:TRINITY_DN112548_c0_g1_i1.p1 TRINITY_DN112548_c0_g1~~TRINITY_DN112548_c0_g1_i1.p1  ORF type:complete len:291 (-),score=26.70 TRINITY_DN112548_c0_g1_i1:147-1019(-)
MVVTTLLFCWLSLCVFIADSLIISTSGGSEVKQPGCTLQNSIYDLGFFDGADATAYLQQGYCVVGVEADPDLVHAGMARFPTQIQGGQLKIVNAAIAPTRTHAPQITFYKNRCQKEWNSFESERGCRTCTPPFTPSDGNCEALSLASLDCNQFLGRYGVPFYLKLDINGAEPGCFAALQDLASAGQVRPRYISSEITELNYIDALASVGYTRFKLVNQAKMYTSSSHSGPWGENAIDCRYGTGWRTYDNIRNEFVQVLNKGFNAADPCPGGATRPSRNVTGQVWYDVHAS